MNIVILVKSISLETDVTQVGNVSCGRNGNMQCHYIMIYIR